MINELTLFLNSLKIHLGEATVYVGFMWLIHILNVQLNNKLDMLGIIPRNPITLLTGPIFSPYLHADFNHLFYNSIPLYIMVGALFTDGVAHGLAVIFSASILEGLLVWLLARKGNHIGASGLIMALFGYFLYQGYYNPSIQTLVIAIVLLYYFGTLLLSIFPADMLTSYEGHFFGLISGVIIAHYSYPDRILILAFDLSEPLTRIAQQLFR